MPRDTTGAPPDRPGTSQRVLRQSPRQRAESRRARRLCRKHSERSLHSWHDLPAFERIGHTEEPIAVLLRLPARGEPGLRAGIEEIIIEFLALGFALVLFNQ